MPSPSSDSVRSCVSTGDSGNARAVRTGPAGCRVGLAAGRGDGGGLVARPARLRRGITGEHPGLDDEAAIRLIYEEVCLRRESGQDVATTEVVSRFPRLEGRARGLARLRPACCGRCRAWPSFPMSASDLGPFRLLRRAGPRCLWQDLSGRRARAGGPAGRLEGHLPTTRRSTCRWRGCAYAYHPAFLGADLSRAGPAGSLHALPGRDEPGPDSRRARRDPAGTIAGAATSLDVLDRRAMPWISRVPTPVDGPYRRYLEQASYVDASAGCGSRLADALAERPRSRPGAHGRQAVERVDRGRWTADAARLPPGVPADRGR